MAVAAPGLTPLTQDSFLAGSWPQHDRIPQNAAEEIIDGLIRDDGQVERRGGSAYKSNVNAGNEINAVWDGFLFPGRRTAFMADGLYALAADDATPTQLEAGSVTGVGRWVEVGGMLLRMAGGTSPQGVLWGGSLDQPSVTSTGVQTATVTQGSSAVVFTGTAFTSTDVKPGGLFVGGPALNPRLRPAVIRSLTSGTEIELVDPWPYATETFTGLGSWTLRRTLLRDFSRGSQGGPLTGSSSGMPVIASQIFGRLVLAQGARLFPSDYELDNDGNQWSTMVEFNVFEEAFQLPEGAIITGLQPLRDQLLVFTTSGVWVVGGLQYADVTDFAGNPQQRVEQVTRDVVLWGDAGVATWRTAVLAPAIDDVYLFDSIGAPTPITGGARRLYRSYVKAGRQPGQAVVHRGHYILPILNGSTWVDTMVWRLDLPGTPFTSWRGHGGSARAWATRVGDSSRTPALLSAVARRVEDATAFFEPTSVAKNDADGTSHSMRVVTRYRAPSSVPVMWRKARIRYDLTDASSDNPTFTATRTDLDSSNSTVLTGSAPEGSDVTYVWGLNRRSKGIRLSVSTSEAAASAVLRSVDVFARPSGRR